MSAASRAQPAAGAGADRAEVIEVPTRHGPARLLVDGGAGARGARARLVLGHGAGGGPASPDLEALAHDLASADLQVVRVEQPWHVAGRRIAPRPATLDEAWLDVLADVPRRLGPAGLTVVGGRSAGARVCARTAATTVPPADAVVLLAFPLVPPRTAAARAAGRPASHRGAELAGLARSGVSVLAVQGSRDRFGDAARIEAALAAELGVPSAVATGVEAGVRGAALANVTVATIPDADHGFVVPRSLGGPEATEAGLASLTQACGSFVSALLVE